MICYTFINVNCIKSNRKRTQVDWNLLIALLFLFKHICHSFLQKHLGLSALFSRKISVKIFGWFLAIVKESCLTCYCVRESKTVIIIFYEEWKPSWSLARNVTFYTLRIHWEFSGGRSNFSGNILSGFQSFWAFSSSKQPISFIFWALIRVLLFFVHGIQFKTGIMFLLLLLIPKFL